VLSVRDLWAHADLSDVILGQQNISLTLDADGGSALLLLTPKFNATLPGPPACV
jgi:hypothetical protein